MKLRGGFQVKSFMCHCKKKDIVKLTHYAGGGRKQKASLLYAQVTDL